MFSLAVLAAIVAAPVAQSNVANAYKAGQVWEYRTRSQDAGSLLRIQKIETDPALQKYGPIYHISVVGVHFGKVHLGGDLAHLPVSRETLDASVTKLSSSATIFPDAEPGIAEWRAANGGVFTIPLAEIIGAVEQTFQTGTVSESTSSK